MAVDPIFSASPIGIGGGCHVHAHATLPHGVAPDPSSSRWKAGGAPGKGAGPELGGVGLGPRQSGLSHARQCPIARRARGETVIPRLAATLNCDGGGHLRGRQPCGSMAFLAAICYSIVMVKIPSQDITCRRALGAGPRARRAASAVGTADSTRPGPARSPHPIPVRRDRQDAGVALPGDPAGNPRHGVRGVHGARIPGSGEPIRSLAAAVQMCGEAVG